MTDQLTTTYLLGVLEETCAARSWTFSMDCNPRSPLPWEVIVDRLEHEPGDGASAGWVAEAGLLQEALADVWAQVTRACREQAARGQA